MKFAIAFCLLIFYLLTAAQSSKVIIYQSYTGAENLVIDDSGKIVFVLPSGHQPLLYELKHDSNSRAFFFYDFADGPMVVTMKDSFYTVDKHGHWIAGFTKKKYLQIDRAHEHIYKASMVDRTDGTFTYVFLDTLGHELFGGKIFDFVTPFSEGLAIVDPVGEEESWQIISISGDKVADFPVEIDTVMFTAEPFSNGLAMVTTGTTDKLGFHMPQKNYYFNRQGNIAIDVFKAMREYAFIEPSSFIGGIAYRKVDYDYTFFDQEGKLIGERLSARVMDISDKLVFITRPYRKRDINEVYDHAFQRYPLPERPNSLVEFALIYEQYIGIYKLDTLTKQFGFELYDPTNNKTIYTTSKKVFAIKNGYVLIGDILQDDLRDRLEYRLLEIENLKNEVLFTITPDMILYNDFESALPFNSKVKLLELWDKQDLEALCKFPNLTKLQIGLYDGSTLPACNQYVQKLKDFGLSFSSSVTALPSGLIGSVNLERLSVLDCPNVTNLEQVIESCKNLKSVTLLNKTLDPAFIERMKIKNPKLNLGGWYSNDKK